jgi:hypothetical protein
MCSGSQCGPLCNKYDPSCSAPKLSYIVNTNNIDSGLYNFKGPDDSNCPDKCCDPNNEYCYRTIDGSGNKITYDQEIMLIFGGISQTEVLINGVNIADNCDVESKFWK